MATAATTESYANDLKKPDSKFHDICITRYATSAFSVLKKRH